ncbi:MAG TPA: CAP domain-containing protein [Pyrinomonadaceae bacterium]|nr:CAP domain-containing protein [Pyrinomonadaceae bacterium]
MKCPRFAAFLIGISILLTVASATGSTVQSNKKPVKPPQDAKPAKVAVTPSDLLAPQAREILAEINLARTNPALYLTYLEDFKKFYRGKEIKYSDGSTLVTNEGVSALEEAIQFVRSVKPLPPLELRKGLILGAQDHVNDLVKTGQSGHRGSDGSTLEDRLNRYGSWSVSVGEDIVYRSRKAREDVIALIIDDGVKSRGHRKNIFKSDFHVIGLALGSSPKTPLMCVITFAGGFADKGSANPLVPTAQKF